MRRWCGGAIVLEALACGAQSPPHTHAPIALPNPAPQVLASPAQLTSKPLPTCVTGTTPMAAGSTLYLDATGNAASVQFLGGNVEIETRELTANERTPVTVRTAGFSLDGFVLTSDLEYVTRRSIEIAGRNLTLVNNTAVRPRDVQSGIAHMQPLYTDFDVAVPLGCTDLGLARAQSGPSKMRTLRTWRPYHLKTATLDLFSAPGGMRIFSLAANRPCPTVWVSAVHGGFARVAYDHGIRVNAWTPLASLATGEGPDCDDCWDRGVIDAIDRCPDETVDPSVDSGCPEPAEPPVVVILPSARPIYHRDKRRVVGSADEGAAVVIHDRQDQWARVHAKGWSVMTAPGAQLWIPLASTDL